MKRAGVPFAALALVVLLAVTPLRASIRVNGSEYVSLTEEAARVGYSTEWLVPGKRIALSGHGHRAEFEGGSREASVDGLRMFLGDPAASRGGEVYVSRIDFYRRLLGILRPSLWGPPPPRPRIIALDPGHGGMDHGTENRRLGIMEKTCTLAVALKLKPLLEERGYSVILTRGKMRDDEPKVPLATLAAIAIAARADLFVSIHFNSLEENPKVQGTEVYMFPPQNQYSTVFWTNNHRPEDIRDASPANRWDPWNAVLSHAMHHAVIADLKNPDRGEKLEHLGVLRPLPVPGVLVEAGFISNDEEATKLASSSYQDRVARALARGIDEYVAVIDSLQPAAAQPRPAVPATQVPSSQRSAPTRPQ